MNGSVFAPMLVLWYAMIVCAPGGYFGGSGGFYWGSVLLFVDCEIHMEMQINIVVPKQNRTKNYAEELGRKERYLHGVVLHQELVLQLARGPPGGYQLGPWHFSWRWPIVI